MCIYIYSIMIWIVHLFQLATSSASILFIPFPMFSIVFTWFPNIFLYLSGIWDIKTKLGVLEFWHRDCFHCMGLGATQMLATGSKAAPSESSKQLVQSTAESNHPGSLSAGSWPVVPCIYLIISYYNVLQYHLYIYICYTHIILQK